MSFAPVTLGSGLAGWAFLKRTYDTQRETFSQSTLVQRNQSYFRDQIGTVQSAEDLVSDRRLLSVALSAFGLSDDLNNRFFIRKVLEEGSRDTAALANKLSDKRYKKLSAAFGFGPGEIRQTQIPDRMAHIAERCLTERFEEAIGQSDETMRLSLYAHRELSVLAGEDKSEDTKWFTLMGTPPLRNMMETALGLPPSFAQLDIDTQLGVFRDRLGRLTGSETIAQFADLDAIERLTTVYLARSQIENGSASLSANATALALLRQRPT